MEQSKDLAIVLRSVAYEERHRIVTALTENHGLISAMARNAIQSRRFGGCLEPFAASEWRFVQKPGAELARVEETQIRRSYDGLRADFERLSMASVFNELMIRVAPKGEPSPELFRIHSNALAVLEETKEVGADLALLNAYLAKLLQWNGNQPQLHACLGCEKPLEDFGEEQHVSCVVEDAGWVCPQCRSSHTHHIQAGGGQGFHHSLMRVTRAAIRDFQAALALPIRQAAVAGHAPRRDHQELFKFLEVLFIYHLPGFDRTPLKGLRFLDVESSWQRPANHPR